MSIFGNAAKWAVNPIGSANSWIYGNLPESARWAIPGYAEQQNYESQKDVLDWQKRVQGINWQREDNAVQRRVADLKQAGLSPVLAAGSAAQAGPPVSVTAPQRQRTPAIETASQVMAMMRQQVDISRTEAEIDAIKAQADKTRTETLIADEQAKRQNEMITSQLGLQSAHTSQARTRAALDAIEREKGRHDLELSRQSGTATHGTSWMSDLWKTLTGQRTTPAAGRTTDAINRAAQSNYLIYGQQAIKTREQLEQAREALQQMRNRRQTETRAYRELENRIIQADYDLSKNERRTRRTR